MADLRNTDPNTVVLNLDQFKTLVWLSQIGDFELGTHHVAKMMHDVRRSNPHVKPLKRETE